jgi:methionyl-tRNA formyltransferase
MELISRIIVLSNKIKELAPLFENSNFPHFFVSTKEELNSVKFDKSDCLFSYSTNVIIPIIILDTVQLAINIHAASPRFPGRDPHHWAIYRDASQYGATLHFMSEKVDEGSIIKSMLFNVNSDSTSMDLLRKADDKALRLVDWTLSELKLNNKLKPSGEKWEGQKMKRRDLKQIVDLTDVNNLDEFRRRIKAFSSPFYNNLFVRRNGYKFYLGT